MTSIEIKNLTIIFGSNKVINNLSFKINKGELFVLLGPSGCGKTTTLRSIAGLNTPSEGEIWLGDNLASAPSHDVFMRPQDRNIAMVFQDYAIYPHLTVYNNIAFPLQVQGVPKSEIDERVKATAKRLQIEHLLDRKPRQLSGGQRQRVALGRAIVRKPRAFLMDEPLSNLDAKLRISARVELKKLQEELGATIVYVTHDQKEAMSLGDRIAILNEGEIAQLGTWKEIYYQPANMFVAEFIGDPIINIINGVLETTGGKTVVKLENDLASYEISDRLESMENGEVDVFVGIRPEHIEISKQEIIGAPNAVIDVIEPSGKESIIHLSLNGLSLVALVQEQKDNVKVGDKIWLLLDEKRIFFFDKETHKNLRYSKTPLS